MIFDQQTSTISTGFQAVIGICISFALFYVLTWARFQYQTWTFDSNTKHDFRAPKIPYTIPWLGSAPNFLAKKPHKFWKNVFSWYPLARGAFAILLGGKRYTIVFDKDAVSFLLKDRTLDRNYLNEQVVMSAMGISREDCYNYYEYYSAPREGHTPGHVVSNKLNVDYLLRSDSVTEMTNEFVSIFRQQLSGELPAQEVGFYTWLRKHMFVASTKSLLGARILEVAPALEEHFFDFDQGMLSLLFSLPKFMVRPGLNARTTLKADFKRWHEILDSELQGHVLDPDAPEHWEPNYGSRINRARQLFYQRQGISLDGRAGFDMGELFGISSNSIMCAGWILFHILASKNKPSPNLYEHLMEEVKKCRKEDGSVNVPLLMTQPIMLSTLHEVLRIYSDTLITRVIGTPMNLPLSHKKVSSATDAANLKLDPGILLAPSWPSHNNPEVWETNGSPSAATFHAYRFLRPSSDSKTDEPVFSTEPYAGSFIPFGGGRTMCPGRTFAKQEILASVAVILLDYDINLVGYLDDKGQNTKSFPGLRDTYPGSGIMTAKGDMKVELKKRIDR